MEEQNDDEERPFVDKIYPLLRWELYKFADKRVPADCSHCLTSSACCKAGTSYTARQVQVQVHSWVR